MYKLENVSKSNSENTQRAVFRMESFTTITPCSTFLSNSVFLKLFCLYHSVTLFDAQAPEDSKLNQFSLNSEANDTDLYW